MIEPVVDCVSHEKALRRIEKLWGATPGSCEELGWSRKQLEPLIGSRARVSEILTGRRPLTLPVSKRSRDGSEHPIDGNGYGVRRPARRSLRAEPARTSPALAPSARR